VSDVLERLAEVLEARKEADPEGSYVARLYAKGLDAILKKVGEEATETVMAAKDGDSEKIVRETADLWFHCLVLLAHQGLGPEQVLAELDRRFGTLPDGTPDGTIVETCPAGEAVAAALALRGGLLLALDYGDWDGTGDTFQALRGHAPTDPLRAPGDADLTAHVGFRWLAEAAPGHRHFFTTQGAFLERLGITERARALARKGGGAIVAQHRRLTHPEEMGTLFKALALVPPGLADPPGFA